MKDKYIKKVQKMRKDIMNTNNKDYLKVIEKEIDNMYQIKPVSLLWFVAKAEVMLKMNKDINEIYEVLNYKGHPYSNYEGIEEYYSLYAKLAKKSGNIYEYKRYLNIIDRVKNKKSNISMKIEKDLVETVELFLQDTNNLSIIEKLMNLYYQSNNYVMYKVLKIYLEINNINVDYRKKIESIENFEYLPLIMKSNKNRTFIILADDKNDNMEDKVLIELLSKLDKDVYYLDIPTKCDVDYMIDMKDTLNISLENIETYNSTSSKIIHPIEVILNGESIGNNIEYILEYIYKISENNLSTIITTGKNIDVLATKDKIKKQLERLSPYVSDSFEDTMAFGYLGKYTSYLNNIYKMDVEKEINKSSECDFSIVIPARNSALSLRETLKTCLNLRYKGSYEIVISDNSTNGNKDVFNLINEINDPRIKYYKTPIDLRLPKSFEYAFLKARGEFIFSIGSDDAVLPWSLEILKQVIDENPNEEIIQWDRGFYAWPHFNGKQENEFVIPRKYEKGKINIEKISREYYLAMIKNNPSSMYLLPLLYINSGFRRNYLNKLIDYTGRLWDGNCQDLYMGIVNILINKYILAIQYPITIAGMTEGSVGRQCQKAIDEMEGANKSIESMLKSSSLCGYTTSYYERLMPDINYDISGVYSSFLRVVARGVISLELFTQIVSWKKVFADITFQLHINDIFLNKTINNYRYIAKKNGKDFLKWFDENIYEKILTPVVIEQSKSSNKKSYNEGFNEQGGQIIDASKYNVKNVYEASLLFEKLTGL